MSKPAYAEVEQGPDTEEGAVILAHAKPNPFDGIDLDTAKKSESTFHFRGLASGSLAPSYKPYVKAPSKCASRVCYKPYGNAPAKCAARVCYKPYGKAPATCAARVCYRPVSYTTLTPPTIYPLHISVCPGLCITYTSAHIHITLAPHDT